MAECRAMTQPVRAALCMAALAALVAVPSAQTTPPSPTPGTEAPTTNSTTIGPDGISRITRVVPVPATVSPEAQALLAKGTNWAPGPETAEAKALIEQARAIYKVTEEDRTIAGVRTRVFTPPVIAAAKHDRVLINLHGGGFMVDSGSFLESIPIASLTGARVISVYYRLATEAPFPAAVDDVVAVYRELLKTHTPERMVIYGTSAGAILTGQVAVRLKHDKLPLPAALGFFTGHGDFSRVGDSRAFFAVPGLAGIAAAAPQPESERPYMKGHDPKDPLASPIYADLTGLPPTLCITATRDTLLSGTVNFHRALVHAGVDAELIVYDALPHAFWYMVGVPESQEALTTMARFFDRHLGS